VKRLIISALLVTALAVPASAGARNFGGGDIALLLKAYKNKFKEVGVGDITLNCDEGKTDTGNSSATAMRWRWKSPPYPSVRRDRRFRIVDSKTVAYPVIDASGNLVGVEKDELMLRIRGRFNRSYSRARGTFRITGSYRGPDPNGPEGYMIQYHHCDSGALQWSAHQVGY
jgi:hypothetical protein